MPDDLYERDIIDWSEHQAALLRRVAVGERRNDVDWPHIIEEIEDVGSGVLNAVRGLLRQAMIHLMKINLSPADLARDHWLDEIDAFLGRAADQFAPSMRQRIDLDDLYAKARTLVLRRSLGRTIPPDCPWTIDELITGDTDMLLASLLAKLTGTP